MHDILDRINTPAEALARELWHLTCEEVRWHGHEAGFCADCQELRFALLRFAEHIKNPVG